MRVNCFILVCALVIACSSMPAESDPNVSGPVVTITNLQCVSQITGDVSVQRPGYPKPEYPLDNKTTTRFDVYGTDLGIVWEIEPGYYGLFFGDTNGEGFVPSDGGGGTGEDNWRGNVLLFSRDNDLEDGLEICGGAMDKTGKYAREICLSRHIGYGDWTSIPTGAVHANGCEYIHYMNIKTWDGWTTNHSKMYRSQDKGQTWTLCPDIEWGGESNFGQVGFFRHVDGYIYMMGTQTGRQSGAKIARFHEENIENKDCYEFWTGEQWLDAQEDKAVTVIKDKVGELSVAYLDKLSKWVVLYISEPRSEITLRWADEPQGPWSDPVKLVSMVEYPICYGSFIHPISYNSDHLYFVMSSWRPYNTYLMKVDVKIE